MNWRQHGLCTAYYNYKLSRRNYICYGSLLFLNHMSACQYQICIVYIVKYKVKQNQPSPLPSPNPAPSLYMQNISWPLQFIYPLIFFINKLSVKFCHECPFTQLIGLILNESECVEATSFVQHSFDCQDALVSNVHTAHLFQLSDTSASSAR